MLEVEIDKILFRREEQIGLEMLGHLYYSLPKREDITVRRWAWQGSPKSLDTDLIDNRLDKITYEEIDHLIREASKTECSTSPSEYVRECKRWLDAQGS